MHNVDIMLNLSSFCHHLTLFIIKNHCVPSSINQSLNQSMNQSVNLSYQSINQIRVVYIYIHIKTYSCFDCLWKHFEVPQFFATRQPDTRWQVVPSVLIPMNGILSSEVSNLHAQGIERAAQVLICPCCHACHAQNFGLVLRMLTIVHT